MLAYGGPARDAVDAAVAECGVGERRSGGNLPAHVTSYVTMAMCLFTEDDYEEVATKLTGALSAWGCWDAGWSVPTAREITPDPDPHYPDPHLQPPEPHDPRKLRDIGPELRKQERQQRRSGP